MKMGALRSFLLDKMDATSMDLRNLTINGLGQVLLGINLPRRKQFLMALGSQVVIMGLKTVNTFLMSFCRRDDLSVIGGDSSIP